MGVKCSSVFQMTTMALLMLATKTYMELRAKQPRIIEDRRNADQ